MKRTLVSSAVVTVSTLLLAGVAAGPSSAARCVSGAEVRGQVSAFVHSLRDDVESPAARAATKGALVESVKAARGAKPDTAEERRGLGAEISVLARQLKDATDKVERAALLAQIHALQEQKHAGDVTAADKRELRGDVSRLARRIIAETDSAAEGRAVAAFARALMAQFDC